MSNWLTTSCKDCGDDIPYHIDWSRVPDLCKGCREARREARAKWHEKACSCGNTIRYHEDWDRIPDLCRDCIAERKAARAKWHEKSCPCGATIRYHEDWDRIPSHCRECNAWLTKPCAAQDCNEEIRYKSFWDRVPDYCKECKGGHRRISVRQEKDDGTVHEYEGLGYVNRQGVAVFTDDSSSGKHSHTAYRADGSLRGHRDEGWGEEWTNEPFDAATSGAKGKERDEDALVVAKHNRFTTAYKDRHKKGVHTHDWSKTIQSGEDRRRGTGRTQYSEGSAGENWNTEERATRR